MHTFIDSKAYKWILSLNIANIGRVKRLVGVDLLKLDELYTRDGVKSERPLLTALGLDLELLASVLYAICEPQVQAANRTPETFAEGLDGPALDAAIRALWSALADFIQPRRPDLAAGIRKQAELIEHHARQAVEKIEALTPEIPGELPGGTLGNMSGNSPASQASTLRG